MRPGLRGGGTCCESGLLPLAEASGRVILRASRGFPSRVAGLYLHLIRSGAARVISPGSVGRAYCGHSSWLCIPRTSGLAKPFRRPARSQKSRISAASRLADYVGVNRIQQRQDGRVVPDLDAPERPSVRVPGLEDVCLIPSPAGCCATCPAAQRMSS